MHLDDTSSDLSVSPAPAGAEAVQPVRITAVIPVYNRAKTVGRAIESMLQQTSPPDEILIVDDGSTDNSAEVVQAFGPKVTYVRQDNAGASNARNTGVDKAKHPWIAFLDSDDYWTPDHLLKLREAVIATDSAADFYFCDMQYSENEGGDQLWDRCGFNIEGDYELKDDGTDWVIYGRQPMFLQASLFSQEAYIKCGGLWAPLKLRHDTHIFYKAAFNRPICAVKNLGTIMTHDGADNRLTSIHHGESRSYWEESELMYKDLLDCVPTRYLGEVRYQLASAHIALGRLSLKSKNIVEGLGHYLKAATISPKRTLEGFAKKF